MPDPVPNFLRGEVLCTVDAHRRLTVRDPLAETLKAWQGESWLVKERPGALSLWPPDSKEEDRLETQLNDLIVSKMQHDLYRDRMGELLAFGRLMSTRRTQIELKGGPRLLLPKEFCDFLGVEAGGKVYVVGAAVCLEIWRPDAWVAFVEERIGDFRQMFDQLTK